MRNREIWAYAGGCLAIGAAGAALGFAINTGAGFIALALALALTAWGLAFTLWRYRKIRALSGALAVAAAGGRVPDMRTNREGELSILQNDLHKVSSALAGRAERLGTDRAQLANALSDISHQLKTPLTGLTVLSDLLQDDSLPQVNRKAFLARISSQLERLNWLVGALLRLSRLDAAVVDFVPEPLVLHKLLSRAAEPVLAMAEQKGVAVRIECARTLTWTGDANWTAEAILNLVKNCVEHAPPGGNVTLRCEDNPLHTALVVEDDGPGFANEDLPRLFERFYRGGRKGDEGVGIGLSMARSIFGAQGAELTAENRPEGGARFVVKLYQRAIVGLPFPRLTTDD